MTRTRIGIVVLIACAAVFAGAVAGPAGFTARPAAQSSDLDQFMARVVARRDENWKKLQQYVLDEGERIEVRGPTGVPIWGERRDYTWFIRDGFFVRSPVSANGAVVPESERRKYETEFLARAKGRDNRGRRGGGPPDGSGGGGPADSGGGPLGRSGGGSPLGSGGGSPDRANGAASDQAPDLSGIIAQSRQPSFIDSAYFLRFKFEQGKYALLGHETFDGLDVLRVEYYPERLFSREQDAQARRDAQTTGATNAKKDMDAALERLMNKVSLVTLWIDPKSYQIVKYTFDNVNMDFLPAAHLMRVDDLKATMAMSQPFKDGRVAPRADVWLPREVEFVLSAVVASGSFSVRYHLDYRDYREATTAGRLVPQTAP